MAQQTKKNYQHLPWQQRLTEEKNCWERGFTRVAGFDEAGRGPLAGPVVAAAFIVRPEFELPELNDSKQLTALQREHCFAYLTSGAWEFGIGIVDPPEIDRLNIYQASRRAMLQALQSLNAPPDFLLVDALTVPETTIPQRAIIHGDALSVAIAAASVIAKVTRDRIMADFDALYPGYGFAKHKGYPTREHYQALRDLGVSPIHRLSFKLKRDPDPDSVDLFMDEGAAAIED